MREQLGQSAAEEWEEVAKEGGVGVDGFVELDGPACVAGAAWLGLLACVLGWYKCVSVVGWSVGRVVWLGCGTGCAGRHGGAPASPYVGASHTPDDDLAGSVSFLFIELARFPYFCLLVLTHPRHGKGDGAGL